MICRIATFDEKPDISEERLAEFWESEEHLSAMKDRVPPGGLLGLEPTSVEIFSVVDRS